MCNAISNEFESSFISRSLAEQIAHCDHYELAPLFRDCLPDHQPILEAGCGSGRWVAWFIQQGWRTSGLDWSAELCDRASKEIPLGRFVQGDMRDMPFAEGEFSAIVSLGAIEHTPEGPQASLREYHRVLRAGGIAVITVPYLGPVRKLMRMMKTVVKYICAPWRPRYASYLRLQADHDTSWAIDYLPSSENRWVFFQYNFSRQDMRAFLSETGFAVEKEFVGFGDEGILHNFGRMAGRYDDQNAKVEFSFLGRVLRSLLPVSWMGHMLCYVVRKSDEPVRRSAVGTPVSTELRIREKKDIMV